MASTITLAGDWLVSLGSRSQTYGTGNLGSYATNGVAVSANQVGLGTIDSLVINPAGGYTFEYIPSTGKVKAYSVTGSGTISGQAAAQTITATSTKPSFTVEASGAIGANMEVGLSADAASATFEGGTGIAAQRTLTTTSPVGTPTITGTNTTSAITATFTGTAGAQVEVANATSLSGVTFSFIAQGR